MPTFSSSRARQQLDTPTKISADKVRVSWQCADSAGNEADEGGTVPVKVCWKYADAAENEVDEGGAAQVEVYWKCANAAENEVDGGWRKLNSTLYKTKTIPESS